MPPSKNAHIPYLRSREEYFDYFGGLSTDTLEGLEKKQLPGGLQKSYLLETVGGNRGDVDLAEVIKRSDLRPESIEGDDGLLLLLDKSNNGVALAERVDSRYIILYTLLPTNVSDALVRRAVADNPLLDHLWLSSQTFESLWKHVLAVNSAHRYGKITFEYEALYESADDSEIGEVPEDERRASRFTMVDRLSTIAAQMEPLRESYAPLASITHLRIPATSGRGGHEVYHDGKVTNRSSSFLDHRSSLLYVLDLYASLTSRVEEKLWISGTQTRDGGVGFDAAVAELVFHQPLSEATFRRWLISLFNNRKNRFRLGGYPTWLNNTKVQASAIDQHLWQPLLLEFTTKRVVAVLPRGTCGNTINRLVSNVQRFVDPRVRAYIGEHEYSSLIPGSDRQHVV